jgi:hypothetical protein
VGSILARIAVESRANRKLGEGGHVDGKRPNHGCGKDPARYFQIYVSPTFRPCGSVASGRQSARMRHNQGTLITRNCPCKAVGTNIAANPISNLVIKSATPAGRYVCRNPQKEGDILTCYATRSKNHPWLGSFTLPRTCAEFPV